MPIEEVLLAVGTTDRERVETLAEAVSNVAGPTDATVHVVHVFSESDFEDAVSKLDFDSPTDADPTVVAKRRSFVRDLTDLLRATGVSVDVTGVVGDTADSILDESDRRDADMVFMSGRKRRPTGKAVFGSSVQEVMLNADCPVTFVREDMKLD